MGDYRSLLYVYWCCKYYIVWILKYRFKILKGNVGKEFYCLIYILCNMKDCEVLELNVQLDYIYLVVIVLLKVLILMLMGVLKGCLVICLFNKFLYIRKKLWGNYFWVRGYFVDIVGVNEEIIRCYVRY